MGLISALLLQKTIAEKLTDSSVACFQADWLLFFVLWSQVLDCVVM